MAQAMPRDQPPATDGYDDRLELRHLLQQFKPNGALTSHDDQVVERVDEGHALLGAESHRFVAGLIVVGAVQDNLCARAARGW